MPSNDLLQCVHAFLYNHNTAEYIHITQITAAVLLHKRVPTPLLSVEEALIHGLCKHGVV